MQNVPSVTITLDEQRYTLDAQENLLQGLLKRGAMINHSCLAGVCRSCRLYDAKTQAPLLSCQTQVSDPLTLVSQPERRYDLAVDHYHVAPLSDKWQWIDATTPFSLELAQPVLWQCGARQGRAFQCAANHESVQFALPSDIDLTRTTLKLADTRARFSLDPSAQAIVICDDVCLTIAQAFQESLAELGIAATDQVYALHAEQPYAALNFKRFDYAFIISSTAVSLTSIEQWLQNNRVRVEQPTYLTFADQ
ncbi:2Fe-2S iron-sulfur cluster-binding protein [Marinomonas ostreistagni]|uniref:2Fe-2S iron-sulfur cluster-binding protein n=1 Tax=Marinomonas ostreistagni TaxID=359209 RepID=UPI001950ACBA|nr:2Fe-2S iron-sulfur cluster binding domain-containing protein [Marinomonas ostreistagni]MBM6549948.1 2Fe-2S iron-sulfur cluster binding domain-containing protein [Marinomonas ostreistagni]